MVLLLLPVLQNTFKFASFNSETISKTCSLLGDEWDAFVGFQHFVRGLASDLDKLLAFAADALPTKKDSNDDDSSTMGDSYLQSCQARVQGDGERPSRPFWPADPPPSIDRAVAACARCILDEYCGFCLDGEASGPRGEGQLPGGATPARGDDSDEDVYPNAQLDATSRRPLFYYHCWEASASGQPVLQNVHNSTDNEDAALSDNSGGFDVAEAPQPLCNRPSNFGHTADVWVHADQEFPDFLSRQQMLTNKKGAATALCRARLDPGHTLLQPTVNNDVPHFIAPSDLSLPEPEQTQTSSTEVGTRPRRVHRSWSSGLRGEECERLVRELIYQRFQSGRRWFYAASKSHWFSLNDPKLNNGVSGSQSPFVSSNVSASQGLDKQPTLSVQDFLDEMPEYMRPAPCIHVGTTLERSVCRFELVVVV